MNTNPIHHKHWTEADLRALEASKSFSDLAAIALSVMSRMSGDLEMVSGPISTGGVGSRDGNLLVFSRVIEKLLAEGRPIFSQMPFEDKMGELYEMWRSENLSAGYCMPILVDFYEAVFSSGRVKKLHFIHGYESSFGAMWEHDSCERWGIERVYLSEEASMSLLRAASAQAVS